MNNSLTLLHGYIDAAFEDCRPMYTRLNEWERDRTRLKHEVLYHGLEILAVVLPAICKHFDRCLGDGLYKPSGLPLTRQVSKLMKVPAFMRDLYLQVFTPCGSVLEDPNVNAILAIRQLLKGLSKVQRQCRKDRVDEEIQNFIDIEAHLVPANLDWRGVELFGRQYHYGTARSELNFADRVSDYKIDSMYHDGNLWTLARVRDNHMVVLQRVADAIATSLGGFEEEVPHSSSGFGFTPSHGKGRVSDLGKNESKYSFPHWPDKLDRLYPYDIYASANLRFALDERMGNRRPPGEVKPSSRLLAVPKTLKGPRLIASEPTSNQWIQQLIWKQLKHKIEEHPLHGRFLGKCVRFTDQELSRALVAKASRDGKLATIDLSSASDRLSLWTLERVFRANHSLLERIHACRSETISCGIDSKHKFKDLVLKKAFSQGSALTFPVQSVVYAILCAAAVIITDRINTGWKNNDVTARDIAVACSRIRVYGDDLIVPTDSVVALFNLLDYVQLKVNHSKTFHTGKFRESCGLDCYDGHDVTPTYIKIIDRAPKHEKAGSAVQASNNLLRNGWWNLAKWQESLLEGLRLPILPIVSEKLGLYSYSGHYLNHLRKRFCQNTHQEVFQVLDLVDNSDRMEHPEGSWALHQWFIEKPRPDTFWSSGYTPSGSAVMRRAWKPLYALIS